MAIGKSFNSSGTCGQRRLCPRPSSCFPTPSVDSGFEDCATPVSTGCEIVYYVDRRLPRQAYIGDHAAIFRLISRKTPSMTRKLCLTILAAALSAVACASTVYSFYTLSDSDGKAGLSADFDDFSGLSYQLDTDTSVDVNVSGGNSRSTVPTGKMLIDFYASSLKGLPTSLDSTTVEIRNCAPVADGLQQIAKYRSGLFGVRTETRWTLELSAVPQACRFHLPAFRYGEKVWISPWFSVQRKSTSKAGSVYNPPSR